MALPLVKAAFQWPALDWVLELVRTNTSDCIRGGDGAWTTFQIQTIQFGLEFLVCLLFLLLEAAVDKDQRKQNDTRDDGDGDDDRVLGTATIIGFTRGLVVVVVGDIAFVAGTVE